MVEEWRPAPGCPGYLVSSLGRVMNAATRRVLLGRPRRSDGCVTFAVGPHRRGAKRTFFVHVLVAVAFIGPRPANCEVNHKDFDRGNNRPDNLEWLTHHDNVLHAVRGGVHPAGERHGRAKLNSEAVKVIRHLIGRRWRRGMSATLAGIHGTSKATITEVARGRRYP